MTRHPYIPFALAFLALSACGGGQGVGFGTVGEGGPGVLPQSTRTEFSLGGVEPIPVHHFRVASEADANPANAATIGASTLRTADANLTVTLEGTTYRMRQVTINGKNFAVVEGGAEVASLAREVRTRSGCLTVSRPLKSGDALVYTLDCS